ncbi:Lrp/AsnC family transcriptional regulator, leucine-responsive regulatory protein [Tistlia consotensis]|uniref:Lrp/AsnC family transcriptional regulator, leucine-responsive regulatory protein n=1 Tax=Tistlia consotensis USBA 355 TaxID=560819 RepID=A0A1Y6B3B1_9PROT|nr:Lrp/AsnC family transcriptional regulator [Tistlia consotensis]SME89237.1 Lrp/AsnC family transcriptional regulator, leucine-responsive regulatory protein [Tistlia consotensis USBA 355]SNR25813.1 Lrp/AsnC family transcriptional regulator, leucine-responsive regulatory protein [Tistlia consotensis]
MAELDSFDFRLLALLQENSRRTGKELSALVGLSAAACLRRVQRLREIGAIEREVAVVAPGFLGRRVTLLVLLTLERDRPERVAETKAELIGQPEVSHVWHVTGEPDFVVKLAVPDMSDYARFTERHFYKPWIKRFESLAVLSETTR